MSGYLPKGVYLSIGLCPASLASACDRDAKTNGLNGKTAAVTGGESSIGSATAQRLVKEGAFVFLFGRRQGAFDAAVEKLGSNATGGAGLGE